MLGLTRNQEIVIMPALASAGLIAAGLAIGSVPVLGNLVIISVFVCVLPYFLHKYTRFLWIKSVEEQFPNFVRDLADSSRSGMSLAESMGISARANYGKLTQEVQSMYNRLSWGTPFLRVLEIFQKNLKDSRIITEALSIVKQSYETGGSIPDTLDSVAKDILMMKEAEAERASLVREQVMSMYGIFFIFLGISVMIVYVMVPMLQSETNSSAGMGGMGFAFTNPCGGGGQALIFPCGFFNGICQIFAVGSGIACYYVAIFFSVVIIQGIFTGLIIGQLSENSAISGSKHSLIMCFAAVGVFLFLAKMGFFPT